MKYRLNIAVVSVFLTLSLELLASPRFLKGRVLLVESAHQSTPAVGLDVAIEEAGDVTKTKAQGKFRLQLREPFGPGNKITLLIDKPGWKIEHPLQGEVFIPANLDGEIVQVRLMRLGARAFLDEKHIQRVIENALEKGKEQIASQVKPQESFDLSGAVQDWAIQYGFGFDDVQAAVDRWAATIHGNEKDLHKRALKALAEQDLGKALGYFEESANLKIKRLRKKKQALAQQQEELALLTEETIKELRLTGDTAFNHYRFVKALDKFEQALALIESAEFPKLWADVQMDIARVHWAIGIRTEGIAIHQRFVSAMAAYEKARDVYIQMQLLESRVSADVGIAVVSGELGIRLGGEEGRQRLMDAVAAYRSALQVYTREQLPQDWATTQNNLGNVLRNLGIRLGGEEGRQQLEKAVRALRLALEIRTKSVLPEQWAQTHNNLAKASIVLQDWKQAVSSYRHTLSLYPDATKVYLDLNSILHEKLHRFDECFTLNQNWLNDHPSDLSATSNFAESHFTTSRFAEADSRLVALIESEQTEPQTRIALLIISIGSLIAQNQLNAVPARLQLIRSELQKQPESFTLNWSFEGTRFFIDQSNVFASWRVPLFELIAGFEGKDRAGMLAAVEVAGDVFK